MSYVRPPFVSEAQPGIDVDCVGCSAISAVDGHKPGTAPTTLAEAKVLRHLGGFPATSGESIGPITFDSGLRARGIAYAVQERYGITPKLVSGSFATLWAALTPGHVAFVIGDVGQCPTTSPFRKYQGGFTGKHCDTVARLDSTDRVWLVDPEGPQSGYAGEWATKAQLARFYTGDAAVLSLAIRTTKKVLACSAQARPNATFGAPIGRPLAAGTEIDVVRSVAGSTWSKTSACNPNVGNSGRKWYVAIRINGRSVSSIYPGHFSVYVYAGAIKGG